MLIAGFDGTCLNSKLEKLIVNSGIGGLIGWIEGIKLVDWQRILKSDLFSGLPYYRHPSPGAAAPRSGITVNILSTAEITSYPFRFP